MTGRLRQYIWALLLACTLAISGYSWCSPEYRAVTILHTNDSHGHLLPFSFPEPPNSTVEYASMPVREDIGGIARRATLARMIEAETPEDDVLFLDAGDALDGTPFSIEYMGEADFAAMSAAGYDMMVIGNHEFSASLDEFFRNIRIANFPIVSANILDRKTQQLILPKYKIYDFQGAKIAVFGITMETPDYRAAKEGLDFLEPFQVAKKLVPELRKQADIVIALTHLGFDKDMKLAKEVPGIDVIIGGHSNNRLMPPAFVPHTSEPQAFSVGGTIVCQDFWWAGELGRLDLKLRRDGGPFTIMSYEGKLIPITKDIPEDPETAKVVDKYYKPISKYYGEVIGEATDTLYGRADGIENTGLYFVCDAIRESSGAQIGIYNEGGVRGDIVKGPIEVWDIAEVFPFRNKLVKIEMTGARLKKALEDTTLCASNTRYRVKGGKLIEATIDGKQIDENAVYMVGTTDFLLGNAFKDIASHKVLSDDYREGIIKYVKAHKTITPIADGRRVIE